MQESIALKTICGPTAYEYIYGRGMPIPHLKTINRHLAKIECQPGILYDFISPTELKVAEMPAMHKYCALVLEEMSQYCEEEVRVRVFASHECQKSLSKSRGEAE